MAPPPAAAPKGKAGSGLTRKLGPLPVWTWGLLAGAVVGYFLFIRKGGSGTTASPTASQQNPDAMPGSSSQAGPDNGAATADLLSALGGQQQSLLDALLHVVDDTVGLASQQIEWAQTTGAGSGVPTPAGAPPTGGATTNAPPAAPPTTQPKQPPPVITPLAPVTIETVNGTFSGVPSQTPYGDFLGGWNVADPTNFNVAAPGVIPDLSAVPTVAASLTPAWIASNQAPGGVVNPTVAKALSKTYKVTMPEG